MTQMQNAWLRPTPEGPKVANKWEHTMLTNSFPSISELEELHDEISFDTRVKGRGRKFRKQRPFARVGAPASIVHESVSAY